MNIFYIDADINECVKAHVDRHVVKMCTEYAQLLSAAHRGCDGVYDDNARTWVLEGERAHLYRTSKSQMGHNKTRWTKTSSSNYTYLFRLWEKLLSEYQYRYGRQHKSSELRDLLADAPVNIPSTKFVPPISPVFESQQWPSVEQAINLNRAYYKTKSHLFSWKNRSVPTWIASEW